MGQKISFLVKAYTVEHDFVCDVKEHNIENGKSTCAKEERVDKGCECYESEESREYYMLKKKYFNDIKNIVNCNCVTVFSKTTCPFCKDVKKIFDSLQQSVKVIEINELDDKEASLYHDILLRLTGLASVPKVFINGCFIGGASETKMLFEKGQLLELISKCERMACKPSTIKVN